jgi:hypothetical protein
MGQKARAGAAALDRARWQRGLDEALAAGAGQPRTDDPVHDEAPGDILQFPGHILPDPAQAPAASGTSPGTRGQFHFHPRDMIGDRAALRFVLLFGIRQLHPRGHRGRCDLTGFQGKLQLLGRLGGRAKPVRAVPCQLMPELLDQDRLRLDPGQKPRGEAAQLLGVFRQGFGHIEHGQS